MTNDHAASPLTADEINALEALLARATREYVRGTVEFLEATYEGRKIADRREQGMGYCGSASYELHCETVSDPEDWAYSAADSWIDDYRQEQWRQINERIPVVLPRLLAERRALGEAIEGYKSGPPTWACPECGPTNRCDEDRCCVTCGIDLEPIDTDKLWREHRAMGEAKSIGAIKDQLARMVRAYEFAATNPDELSASIAADKLGAEFVAAVTALAQRAEVAERERDRYMELAGQCMHDRDASSAALTAARAEAARLEAECAALRSPDGARVVAVGGEILTGSQIYARCIEEVRIRHRLEAEVADLRESLVLCRGCGCPAGAPGGGVETGRLDASDNPIEVQCKHPIHDDAETRERVDAEIARKDAALRDLRHVCLSGTEARLLMVGTNGAAMACGDERAQALHARCDRIDAALNAVDAALAPAPGAREEQLRG